MYRSWTALNNFVREHRALTLVAGGVVLFMALAFLLWLLVGPDNPREKISFIQTLGGLVGGAALAAGLYFTARNLQVNREGQITERFTRAIDQLGATGNNSKQLEIRLGGIYALERIARDSEQDHWPIMEVLTAYVRQHSARECPEETREEGAAESEHAGSGPTYSSNDSVRRVLDADTQAIITVIRRRTRSFGQGEPESLDLHDTYLNKANLREANLREANLWGANLQEAVLGGVDLQEANLQEAVLQEADLLGANLWRADLWGADLQEANLWRADLREAKLWGADLREAKLWGADLGGADLGGAHLEGANLGGAQGLTQEQINEAYGDDATVLLEGLVRPAHWSKSTQEQPNGEE